MLAAAADLLGSTSVDTVADGFPSGFLDFTRQRRTRACWRPAASARTPCAGDPLRPSAVRPPHRRRLVVRRVPRRARAHPGAAARDRRPGPAGGVRRPVPTAILVCAHAGLKTGEDGPTHADPQPLQLVQENFPQGTVITLTPWDPAEIWPLVTAALGAARR